MRTLTLIVTGLCIFSISCVIFNPLKTAGYSEQEQIAIHAVIGGNGFSNGIKDQQDTCRFYDWRELIYTPLLKDWIIVGGLTSKYFAGQPPPSVFVAVKTVSKERVILERHLNDLIQHEDVTINTEKEALELLELYLLPSILISGPYTLQVAFKTGRGYPPPRSFLGGTLEDIINLDSTDTGFYARGIKYLPYPPLNKPQTFYLRIYPDGKIEHL